MSDIQDLMEGIARLVHRALTRIPTALQYALCVQQANIQASGPTFLWTTALYVPTSRILFLAAAASQTALATWVTRARME